MIITRTLETLSNASGVVGREDEVRDLMRRLMKPYTDEVREDRLGNIIGTKTGKKGAPKIMLAAHMDEIGLLLKTITKKGFLKFVKMGGIDDRVLLAQKVIVFSQRGPLHGIVGSKPPHIQKEEERKKPVAHDKLFIDIGAKTEKEARRMGANIGDPIGFDIRYSRIGKEIVIGKAFDDRVGCAVMVEIMKRLKDTKSTVCAVGTVQEEVGLRGAGTAAFGILPDVGIALDVTVAGDTPGIGEAETSIKIGSGPSVTVADRGLVTHPKVLRLLVETGEKHRIPYQLETGLPGSTDAARISLTREGVPSGVISVPTRYIHSPTALLSLKDAENSVKLAIAAIEEIPQRF